MISLEPSIPNRDRKVGSNLNVGLNTVLLICTTLINSYTDLTLTQYLFVAFCVGSTLDQCRFNAKSVLPNTGT